MSKEGEPPVDEMQIMQEWHQSKISEDLIESIKNTHILTEVGGKTPEQIVESGADLVNDNINQHLSNEQENDVVPELIRVKQEYNNNSNNTN